MIFILNRLRFPRKFHVKKPKGQLLSLAASIILHLPAALFLWQANINANVHQKAVSHEKGTLSIQLVSQSQEKSADLPLAPQVEKEYFQNPVENILKEHESVSEESKDLPTDTAENRILTTDDKSAVKLPNAEESKTPVKTAAVQKATPKLKPDHSLSQKKAKNNTDKSRPHDRVNNSQSAEMVSTVNSENMNNMKADVIDRSKKQMSSDVLTQDVDALSCTIPQPDYPARARRLNQEGQVKFRITVNATGEITNAKVIESSKYTILDNAGLKAIMGGHCKPYLLNGKPASVTVVQPVDFKLG
ncbi:MULTISPECIES: energy transducer TonB [unclassified Brenneria]|uniref:energy transducer TonB n=1 Tax=unclassified Brenneria TaxID=2634434 RepID=UPI0029C1AE19|nr:MULTISPECIES: energy transducer TonB [unclassified Brenneria]MDX5630847.1 energy transducer TonB [Brenneria sp. L3-3Z]MDX5697929.1 energy transducer TonB [Brenneria sp. L4-2C]